MLCELAGLVDAVAGEGWVGGRAGGGGDGGVIDAALGVDVVLGGAEAVAGYVDDFEHLGGEMR